MVLLEVCKEFAIILHEASTEEAVAISGTQQVIQLMDRSKVTGHRGRGAEGLGVITQGTDRQTANFLLQTLLTTGRQFDTQIETVTLHNSSNSGWR